MRAKRLSEAASEYRVAPRLALRLEEAAAALGVDDETARRWLVAGLMPGRKVRGTWLVSVRDHRDGTECRVSAGR